MFLLGVLLAMPGYIGNYSMDLTSNNNVFNTLACKLVTSFPANEKLSPPISSILGTIFLFDTTTGKLYGILEATAITAWRTAAASLVSTKHLYFNRHPEKTVQNTHLAIIGCGVQGRIHAIGMCNTFPFSTITLWNRTISKANNLAAELETLKSTFLNKNVTVCIADSAELCALNADVIVTATYASTPILYWNMIKEGAHINGNNFLY